jgi:hypothetical protein
MALELTSITFNHDPTSSSTSGMNIRRNKDFEVLVPEYEASVPRPPAESCAAYPIWGTKGQAVTIKVKFTIPAPADVSYEVRASGGGVAGHIDPVTVTFSGTAEVDVHLPLSHRDFERVGRHDITWRWEFLEAGANNWTPLLATSHRIYLTLTVPTTPWTQAFADKRNPWTDLLDECCVIAADSAGEVSVTRKVVMSVNRDYSLRYDINWGSPRYDFAETGSSFHLTNWIDYVLRGNAPASPVFCPGSPEEHPDYQIVNCYDCAASVALMCNVLGVSVEYHFHEPFGFLRYVEPIGRGKCNNPFYSCYGGNAEVGPDDWRTGFGNHAYPRLGGDRNYDACMREWLPPLLRLLLVLIWLLVLIMTLGLVNLRGIRDRAGGWLMDLFQSEYERRTIDRSRPFESAAAGGGAPAPQVLQFQVT